MNRKRIDCHAHLVQYIAGQGAEGELRALGDGSGRARYATGSIVQMIPADFQSDSVTPEKLLQVMDHNNVVKAVLLQGNFYGFQNLYTAKAVAMYPDRFTGAASYDPFSYQRDRIREYLFEDLPFRIEKWELSTGSGLMAVHPDLKVDGPVMREAFQYAAEHQHILVIDLGKCGSPSWQIAGIRSVVQDFPDSRFVFCHLLAPDHQQRAELEIALKQLDFPNVWFDTSSLLHNVRLSDHPEDTMRDYLHLAADLIGSDRLLFGTDFPSCMKEHPYSHCIESIEQSPLFTDEEKDKLFYTNAEALYFPGNGHCQGNTPIAEKDDEL